MSYIPSKAITLRRRVESSTLWTVNCPSWMMMAAPPSDGPVTANRPSYSYEYSMPLSHPNYKMLIITFENKERKGIETKGFVSIRRDKLIKMTR